MGQRSPGETAWPGRFNASIFETHFPPARCQTSRLNPLKNYRVFGAIMVAFLYDFAENPILPDLGQRGPGAGKQHGLDGSTHPFLGRISPSPQGKRRAWIHYRKFRFWPEFVLALGVWPSFGTIWSFGSLLWLCLWLWLGYGCSCGCLCCGSKALLRARSPLQAGVGGYQHWSHLKPNSQQCLMRATETVVYGEPIKNRRWKEEMWDVEEIFALKIFATRWLHRALQWGWIWGGEHRKHDKQDKQDSRLLVLRQEGK